MFPTCPITGSLPPVPAGLSVRPLSADNMAATQSVVTLNQGNGSLWATGVGALTVDLVLVLFNFLVYIFMFLFIYVFMHLTA